MWKFLSFTILILVVVARSEDNLKPPECNGPPPFRVVKSSHLKEYCLATLARGMLNLPQCCHRGPFQMTRPPRECCDKPMFKPDFKNCLNATRALIMKRFHDGEDVSNGDNGDDDTCLSNCFFNKNVFTDAGVSRNELVNVLESQSDDAEWNSVHSIAVDKCISDLEPEFQNADNMKWIKKCNRIAVRMIMCLNGQYFANCPETYFKKDNEKCIALQEHIKQCPMPGPWGPGKHGKHSKGSRGFGPSERFIRGPSFGPGNHGFGGPPPFGHGMYSEGPFGFL